jgi:hypothetical protein
MFPSVTKELFDMALKRFEAKYPGQELDIRKLALEVRKILEERKQMRENQTFHQELMEEFDNTSYNTFMVSREKSDQAFWVNHELDNDPL